MKKVSFFNRIINFFKEVILGKYNPKMIYYHLSEKINGHWPSDDEDDFNWSRYTLHYKGELELGAKTRSLTIDRSDYTFKNEKLIHESSNLPLHPNAHIIYETTLLLGVKSVIEVGCGGGDNLHNLKILKPSLDIKGIDISSNQINLLSKRHPNLTEHVSICDITNSTSDIEPVDLVFTNAVLMHIGTANGRWASAMRNLFSLANDHIILMEHWSKHEYIDFINNLEPGKDVPWKNINLYMRKSVRHDYPSLLIISQHQLPYDKVYNSLDLAGD